MAISHMKSLATIVITALHISSFSMHNMITFTDFPQELNQKMFDDMSFCSQDRMRGACKYWKMMGDSRTSFHNLLSLLHGQRHKTKEVQTRALFAAVYRGDCDFAEIILKKTPIDVRLSYPCLYSIGVYDPYFVSCDEDMISLLETYKYHITVYGRDAYGQIINCAKFPEPTILKNLLVLSIIGDNHSIATIINVHLKNPDIRAEIMDKRVTDKLSKYSCLVIKQAFEITVHNDDNVSLSALVPFLSDDSAEDWWVEKLFKQACRGKKKKVLELLLQQKKDINEVQNGRHYGDARLVTFKNMILGINWSCEFDPQDQDYYKEIEALLNKYGAKTYEELQSQKN